MNKMTNVESQVNVVSAGFMKVDGKTLEQEKDGKGETKKKQCTCAPTSHPGSFRCRYHRPSSEYKVKAAQDPSAAVARHFLKLSINNKNTKPSGSGVKPQASRFSKAAANASEFPR